MTEVWVRNPNQCIRECVEVGALNLVWDRGFLVKRNIDPQRVAELYIPPPLEYRQLILGDQGTAELRRGDTMKRPTAVYPTWVCGVDPPSMLEELLASPVGDDPDVYGDFLLSGDCRPVNGQEHRVVITDMPPVNHTEGRRLLAWLAEVQEEYPDAIIHLHGLYSWRAMFGRPFGSVDIEPRITAQKGKVMLPNGKEVKYEVAAKTPQWVQVCGWKPRDLEVPRNRCMYNIKSAEWAAEHFRENIKFRVTGKLDDRNTDSKTVGQVRNHSQPVLPGDKFQCDSCSLQTTCKYFRVGSVCSLPDSEVNGLARFFKTRDSNDIIEGLGALMSEQTDRMEMGRRIEEQEGELIPEVTAIINGLFDRGVKLAKLVNPALAARTPLVGIQVNGGQVGATTSATPQQLAAQAVAALEEKGYGREDVTDELVEAVLRGDAIPDKAKAIEAIARDA